MGSAPFNYFMQSMINACNDFPNLYLSGFHKQQNLYNYKTNSELEKLALVSIGNYKLFSYAHDYFTRNKNRISVPVPANIITKLFDKNDFQLRAEGKEGIILIAARCAGVGITTDKNSIPNLIYSIQVLVTPKKNDGGILDD